MRTSLTTTGSGTGPRYGRPTALALGTVLLAMTLVGCAGEDEARTVPAQPGAGSDAPVSSGPGDASSTPTPPPDAGKAAAQPADLTVSVDDGSGTTTETTLTCEPVGGTVEDPQKACVELAMAGAEAFSAPATDQMCTQLFGGPQVATVSGTFAGQPVQATFARTNGCEISRWDSLASLLGPVQLADS